MADFSLESDLLASGFKYICGVDEVGRGALFGPVVAGAVIMNPDCLNREINDSKKLSKNKRRDLACFIYEKAWSCAIGWSWPDEIDRLNILQATRLAMRRAVSALPLAPDFLLVDGLIPNFLPLPGRTVIQGDQQSYSIAAASIIAKVFRDQLLTSFARFFPDYDLQSNAGYPTKKHKNVILSRGMTVFHRRSFYCRHER